MVTVLGANSVTGGYDVENSLRFNSGSSEYLLRTHGTNHTAVKFAISFWIKRSDVGNEQVALTSYTDGNNTGVIRFNANNTLEIFDYQSSYKLRKITNRVFRDISAWYHIVVSVDTAQGTASNRFKLYVNGVQETSFSTDTNYSEDDANMFNKNVLNWIGANPYNSGIGYTNGYMSEFVFIDGLQLAPTSFGEFDSDSGIWKPIKVSGLTFGDNGYYLEFKQAGTSQNASGMGADTSGNTDHWAVASLTAVDQSTDTCTNNFATMNSLDNFFSGSAFTEGNCKIVTTNGNITYNTSTIGFSSGKWYMETKLAGSAGFTVGVVRGVATANDNDNKLGNRADGFSYDDGGAVEGNGGDLGGSFATYEADDIIGVYVDLDNNELYFSKNGALQNSGTGLALTAGTYFFAVGDNNSSNSSTYEVNFGNPVSALSSAVSDGEYGAFEYSTTITGDSVSKTFKALNTKNLAEFG